MPTEEVCSARSAEGSKEVKTTTCRRARGIATLSRRSPPTRVSGPKASGSTPREARAGAPRGGAGGRPVGPPLAPDPGERAEVQRQHAARVQAGAQREEHGVALLALHLLHGADQQALAVGAVQGRGQAPARGPARPPPPG